MTVPRVLVVDDHPIFRRGVIGLLQGSGACEVVGEVADVPSAMATVSQLRPDIVLLDIRLGDESGLTLLAALRAEQDPVRVIVLSVFDEPSFRRVARAAGAQGYVNKQSADTELLAAIRAVQAGGEYFGGNGFDRASESGSTYRTVHLAGRERAVMRLVALGHTNRAIAERFKISVKTVEGYRARVMQKLGFNSRADLVRYALEVGLIGTGEEAPPDP